MEDKYITLEDIAEINRLKKLRNTIGYSPSDIASITNLYRLYINKNASSCASCGNKLAEYANGIYGYLGNFEQISIDYFSKEEVQEKSAAQQVEDYTNTKGLTEDGEDSDSKSVNNKNKEDENQ